MSQISRDKRNFLTNFTSLSIKTVWTLAGEVGARSIDRLAESFVLTRIWWALIDCWWMKSVITAVNGSLDTQGTTIRSWLVDILLIYWSGYLNKTGQSSWRIFMRADLPQWGVPWYDEYVRNPSFTLLVYVAITLHFILTIGNKVNILQQGNCKHET